MDGPAPRACHQHDRRSRILADPSSGSCRATQPGAFTGQDGARKLGLRAGGGERAFSLENQNKTVAGNI